MDKDNYFVSDNVMKMLISRFKDKLKREFLFAWGVLFCF